jgi:iron complex outermembrane receptor protein
MEVLKINRARGLMGAVSGLALMTAGFWATPTMAATEAPAAATRLEEVVVTAQKRAENLQDVPISVTAVTASALEAHRFELLSDLSGLAPNVSLNSGLVGQNSIIAVVRGLASAPVFPGQSEGVSFYLDGVYLGNVYGSLLDLADVQQIEVLKGPQGTLFGRSSVGGAISIISTNPTGQFHVTETLTAGNYNQFRNKTHVELPQMGPFTANFTYLHFQRDGDIKNLGGGTVWDLRTARASLPVRGTHQNDIFTSPNTLGDQDVDAVAGTIRFQPIDAFTASYKFDYSHNDYTPYGNGISYIGPAGNPINPLPPGTSIPQVIAAQTPGTVVPVANLERPKAVNDNFDGPSTEVNYGHALTLEWHPNEYLAFKDIAAYRHNNVVYEINTIGTGGLKTQAGGVNPCLVFGGAACFLTPPALQPGPLYPPGSPAYGTPFIYPASDNDYRSSQTTNEFQVFLTTKWFTLTSGYMYYSEHAITYNLKQIIFPNAAGTYVTGAGTAASPYVLPACGNNDQYTECPANAALGFGLQTGDQKTSAKSNAIYTQAKVHITSQIDFDAGIRRTWDSSTFGGEVPVPPLQTTKEAASTYLLGLNYKPTSDILLYAKWSTGYIPGSIFNARPYGAETATSYEAGLKADWFDHTVRTNVSVFDVTYRGFQVFSFDPVFGLIVINRGAGKAKGFEFEGTWKPTSGLTLGTNVGYTDMVFGDHADPASRTLVAFVPKWTLNFNGQYESDPIEAAWGGRFVIHGDANYTSEIQLASGCAGTSLSCSNSTASLAATGVGPQWLVNGRMGLVSIPAGHYAGYDTTLDVALWVKNLTDNKSLTQATYQFRANAFGAGWQPARTFGVDVTAKF